MNGNDTFLDVNDAHLRVTSGNVYASAFNLDQIDIVMSSNTASTVNFNNPTKAFNAASNIEVGTANLFVDTTTTRVGVGTASPATTLDVAGDLNVSGNLTIIGTTTTLDTDHLRVKDPIIELGKDNTASPGVDLGLVMTRPSGSSNVGIIFDESATRLEIGYTQGTASDSTITMDSTPLSVNVNGTISGNGSGLTALDAANITSGTLDRNTTGSAATLTTPRTIGGVNFDGSADIVPTTFGAATFDTDTLVVDSVNDRVGIGTTDPGATLDVQGDVELNDRFTIKSTQSTITKKSFTAYNNNGTTRYWKVASGSYSGGRQQVSMTVKINRVDYLFSTRRLIMEADGGDITYNPTIDEHDIPTPSYPRDLRVYKNTTNSTFDIYIQVNSYGNVDVDMTYHGSNITVYDTPTWEASEPTTSGTYIIDFTNGNKNAMKINNHGKVGVNTTSPNATLHVKNETESSGAGDVYIPGVINKPTECLRLQNKWYNTGSGALLRFTNQHPQGTNPSTGEYNLAGIAGYDHDGGWGGGLAFYTSSGTGSGGDNLTLRMSIDSVGAVNIPGPTTGASHGSASMLYLLDTCFFKEWSYANYVAPTVKVTFNTSTEIPDGAKAVLAEVFLSRDDLTSGDHQIHVLGKSHLGNSTNWRSGAGQPSTAFSADVDVRQTVELLMPGESDGFTHYFGKWHSSVIIPIENNQIYYSNRGNSSSTGWVYMRVRGYYI